MAQRKTKFGSVTIPDAAYAEIRSAAQEWGGGVEHTADLLAYVETPHGGLGLLLARNARNVVLAASSGIRDGVHTGPLLGWALSVLNFKQPGRPACVPLD